MAIPDRRGRCRSVAPIMPTTDIARTKAEYLRLGFAVNVYNDEFVMTARDDIEIFFSLHRDHDPLKTAACIYVRVSSADVLHAEWEAAKAPGLKGLRDTEYSMREFAYLDADNNLLLFGSRLEH